MSISDKKYKRKMLDPKYSDGTVKGPEEALRKKQGCVDLGKSKPVLPGKYGDSELHNVKK